MRILILFILITISISAKKLKTELDYAIYYPNKDSISIELYYEFQSKDLKYELKDTIYQSKVLFHANIKSLLNNYNFNWELISRENSLKENRLIFGIKKITLPISQYKLKLSFQSEIDSNLNGNKKIEIIPKSNKKHLSDIYFATRITKIDSTQIAWSNDFLKNDHYIIPNSSKQYFSDRATLLSYVELYNLKDLNNKNFTLEYKVIDAVNSTKKVVNKVISDNNSEIISDNLNIPIQDLATGVYYLKASIKTEENTKAIDVSSKKFFYLNFDIPPDLKASFTEDELFERSEYITLDEETLQKEYEKIKNLMTKNEAVRWDELSDLNAKRRAMFNYWRVRDSDTTTSFNETKADFDRAVQYADEYFSYMKGYEGWRTDRGKILLKYGFPMVVDRFPRNGEKIPCEIWYYGEGGGGAYFYFVDKTGYSNYILVHSTVFGETRNEYWMEDYNPAVNFDMNIKRSEHYFK